MSKIEAYKKAKGIAARVEKNRDCTFKLDSPRNDKGNFWPQFINCKREWSDACIHLHASFGYYGSSSGYSAMDEETGKYLTAAIAKHGRLLFDTAVKMAADDAEKARKEAEEEAKSVLQATTEARAA